MIRIVRYASTRSSRVHPRGHRSLWTTTAPERQQPLLQRFWNEAGGYGARILICATPGTEAQSGAYATLLRAMEAESIQQIQIHNRSATNNADYHAAIDQATGILLVATTPAHVAALLGGTQLATTLRRANANTTVEVFGANNVVIVDGNAISYTDVAASKRHSPISVHGVQLHVLKHGQTFNFDSHQAEPQAVSDIPVEGSPNQ